MFLCFIKLKPTTMKKILLISTLCLCWILSTAQTTFERSFGGANIDSIACVRQTSDGGYIICGSTNSFGAGNYDVYVVKTNSSGNKQWSKTYGGPSADFGNSIQQTTDGGYIITGSSKSFNFGEQNVYLIKTDSNGVLIWSEAVENTGSSQGNTVIQTSDGGYAVAGSSTFLGQSTIYFLKTAADGTGIFDAHLAYNGEGNSLVETNNGEYVLCGTVGGYADSLTRNFFVFITNNGYSYFANTYRSDNYSYHNTSVFKTSDGGFLIGGNATSSTTNVSSGYTIRMDFRGANLWTKLYAGVKCTSIQQTAANGYLLTGTITSGAAVNDVFMTNVDQYGSILWSKSLDGIGKSPVFVNTTSDAGFVIAGNTTSYGQGGLDAYLVKTNSNGSTSCEDNMISLNGSAIISIENFHDVDAQGMHPSFSGYWPSPSAVSAATAGIDAASLSTTRCYTPPPAAFMPVGINAGEITEVVEGTDSIDDLGNKSIVSNGSDGHADEVVNQRGADETLTSVTTEMISKDESLNVFPNPSNGSNINISITTEKTQEVLVVVYDELGRESYSKIIFTGENAENTFAIDPSGKLKPGIYMITATSEKNTYIKRLIVK